jgi:hypothetical protein
MFTISDNNLSIVKRLIRNRATHRFLRPDGGWSEDWTAARRFEDVSSLIRTALQMRESRLEEVLVFGEAPSQLDTVLPLWPH